MIIFLSECKGSDFLRNKCIIKEIFLYWRMKGYTSASAPPTLHHIDNTRSWRVVRSRQPSLTQINTCQVLYSNIKKPSPRNINYCRGETARCFRLVLGLYLFYLQPPPISVYRPDWRRHRLLNRVRWPRPILLCL